jgi:hypothetical protein
LSRALKLVDIPNYSTRPFLSDTVPSNKPFIPPGPRVQYYPSKIQREPAFSGDFESGNLKEAFKTGPNSFEISILPDPSGYTEWFFFSCSHIKPGQYTFVITGFHRQCSNFHRLVCPVAYSMNEAKNNVGWMRIRHSINFWKASVNPIRFKLSFTFLVMKEDTIYFAFLYPYTITQLRKSISMLPSTVVPSVIAKSEGCLDISAIFWDADCKCCRDVQKIHKDEPGCHKPFICIAARLHPGESNSSFAMEGLMTSIFANTTILNTYSILLIPIVNVDGVECGFYRTDLKGQDLNRVWLKPKGKEAIQITQTVYKIAST